MFSKMRCDEREKRIIANVYKVCEEERLSGQIYPTGANAALRTAHYTGVSLTTVYRTVDSAQSTRELQKRGPKHIVIDDFDRNVIQRTIRSFIVDRKVLPTAKSVLHELQKSINYPGKRDHLIKVMKELGFVWKRCGSNRKVLMERTDVVLSRINFLRKMKMFREEGRTIVYTDETFVHSSHSTSKCWQSEETSVNVPFSKGERLIVVHAGSELGFVQGAELVFKAKSCSGDYQNEMNFDNFFKWLSEKLIPNMPTHSVLVLDNAAYYNVQEDKCPTQSYRKAEIQAWLDRNNIKYSPGMLKVELLDICKKNRTTPTYKVDQILKQHGHDCIRLPPYHADLNPIEMIWANLKGKISRRNFSFKLRDVRNLITEAMQEITAEDWMKCCHHVQKAEEKYWASDIAVESELERLVIEIESSSATDTADEDDEETETASE